MNQLVESPLYNFPGDFRTELAQLQAGATNGGSISPRRHVGLLIAYERVKNKYDAKIATLRGHGRSPALDEVEMAITDIAAEFSAALSTDRAA